MHIPVFGFQRPEQGVVVEPMRLFVTEFVVIGPQVWTRAGSEVDQRRSRFLKMTP
jgi:hypothetical protein